MQELVRYGILPEKKNKMEFTDQSCTCLKLDNTNGAMAAAWKKEEELLFTRI